MEIRRAGMANLTPKQKAFCEIYAGNGGNATQAAIDAGYSENGADVQGSRLLVNASVLDYIRELSAPAENKRIADATEIKEFWTYTMRDNVEKMDSRLRASENLAKSGAMFIDKVEQKTEGTLTVQIVKYGDYNPAE